MMNRFAPLSADDRRRAEEMTSDLSIWEGPAVAMAVVLIRYMERVDELEARTVSNEILDKFQNALGSEILETARLRQENATLRGMIGSRHDD